MGKSISKRFSEKFNFVFRIRLTLDFINRHVGNRTLDHVHDLRIEHVYNLIPMLRLYITKTENRSFQSP